MPTKHTTFVVSPRHSGESDSRDVYDGQSDVTSIAANHLEDEQLLEVDDEADGDYEPDDGGDTASLYARSYYHNMRFYDAPIDMGIDDSSL
jgi:hypothetical protein